MRISNYLTRNLDLLAFAVIIVYKILLFNQQIGVTYPKGLVGAVSGTVLVVLSLIVLFPIRPRLTFLYLFNLLVTVVILADLLFYRYYSDVISIPVLLQVSQAGSVKESVLSLFQLKDTLYFLDLLLFLPILLFFHKRVGANKPESLKRKITQAVILLIIGISLVTYKVADLEQKMGKSIFTNILDQTFFVENIGVVNFHAFDIYKYTKKQLISEKLSVETAEEIHQLLMKNEANKPKEPKYFGLAKGNNLIVVQVEALQSFVLNREVNGQEITPNLNKLLQKSIYFRNYYFQTAQGNTSDAEFTSNVSYYPAQEGSVYFQYAGNNFNSLATVLKEEGYTTTAMHAYKPSYWNRAAMYRSLGFDSFLSREDFVKDEMVGWGLGDNSFLQQATKIMAATPKPFYSFLVTLSSHYPYTAFAEDTKLNTGNYHGTFLGNYLQAIHYTDQALGNFVEELKLNGLWDNSVVVIYGDHSAISKVEKDELLQLLSLPEEDLVWAKLQKVPLVVHLPEDKLAGTRDIVGGQVDLFPTLSNLLGQNPQNLLGQDLLNANMGKVIFRNGSYTDDKVYYLSATDTIYDLITGQKLPAGQYKNQITAAQKMLWLSDQVLEHNLMGNLTSLTTNNRNQ